MRRYHGAPERNLVTGFSAQHLADRSNRHGAYVRLHDGQTLWIGSPLRVHRRCVDPMFSLANGIAYNNQMVLGVDSGEEQKATVVRPLMGPSGWIDVSVINPDEHYEPAQGRKAFDVVALYQRNRWVSSIDGLPDLFVISPFASVAENLRRLLKDDAELWAGDVEDKVLDAWLKDRVGTVHTFQGKECESVVFVLGGATPGAIGWAAGSPNIINVAATRAKRRLYVIGDRSAWKNATFGRELSRVLRHDCDPELRSFSIQSAAFSVT